MPHGTANAQLTRAIHPLGDEPDQFVSKRFYNSDGTWYDAYRLYNGGSALTAGAIYRVSWSGAATTTKNPQVAAPATAHRADQDLVVAIAATAASVWGWFAYQGHVDARVDGTVDLAAGDFLRSDGTNTYLVSDGTTRSPQSVGMVCEAYTTNSVASKRVLLFGTPVESGGPSYHTEKRFYNSDGTWYDAQRLYNGTGGALTAAGVYRVIASGAATNTPNPQVAAPAAIANVYQEIVVAISATADASWDWFACRGHVDCRVEGTTNIAADDFLKTTTTNTYFITDGTTRTVNSIGKACEAFTTDAVGTKRIFLPGWLGVLG